MNKESPEQLGERYERRLSRDERRRRGAFYTPSALAADIARATLEPLLDAGADPSTLTVCDPAVGGGALLLAAARLLIERGAPPASVAHHVYGTDTDAGAVAVAREAITLLTGTRPDGVAEGDGLAPTAAEPFDAVITNPPFLAQLKQDTARGRDDRARLSSQFGDASAAYVDGAALFLVRSCEMVRTGGRVGIVLPEPIVATRDAAPARRRVGERSRLARMWSPGAGAFDAGIRVRIAVIEVGLDGTPSWRNGDWSLMATGADDPPALTLDGAHTLGEIAAAAADFRDQFYGLGRAAIDTDSDHPKLVTCGLIDPALLRWGQRAARIAGQTLHHPRVDVETLTPKMQEWAATRRVPKVLVATQTRLLEAIADDEGDLLPVVPVITVTPTATDLDHILAVLLAPPVAAHARRLHAGAALSADAIKLSARQIAALPLPRDADAWTAGAHAARAASDAGREGDASSWRAALDALASSMCDAYQVPSGPLMRWWSERLDRVALNVGGGNRVASR